MEITESYNPESKCFVYEGEGEIDSNDFRKICFEQFCVELGIINHRYGKTIGYSKEEK